MKSSPLTNAPHVKRSAELEPLNVVGERIRVLDAARETGSFEVFLQEGDAGIGPPPHFHAWDEAYFVLEGEIDVQLGDERRAVGPGEYVFVPAGTLHCYRNRTPARFLSLTSREGAAQFFAAMDREVGFPVDLRKAVDVAGRNGVHVPPPPAAT